jgi:mannose-1-phosphate guanylyltransferase
VDRFVEKPKKEMAEEIIGEGALWNCGVFCFKIRSIKEYLEKEYAIRDFSYESIDQKFSTLPKKSFDYEVLEKAANIGVVSYQGMWMDLGTWQTVTSEMSNLKEGNVLLGEHCNNTHVINDLGLPIVVMGVEDSVVVASNDGILVSKKDETYKLKDLVGDFDKRPMYERKRWGKYRVIHEGENIITKQLLIFEGKQLSYQYHEFRKEIWTIIKGEGELYHEGKKTRVFPGGVVQIEKREKHGIRAIKDLEIIEVQMGEKLSEDDIIRLEMRW